MGNPIAFFHRKKNGLFFIFSFVVLLFAHSKINAQNWERKDLDSYVSVLFPGQVTAMDTLGARIYSAPFEVGTMICEVRHLNVPFPQNQKELDVSYSNIIKTSLATVNGKLIDSSTLFIQGLKAKRAYMTFVPRGGPYPGVEYANNVIFILGNHTLYCFEVIEPNSVVDGSQPQIDRFFNSIKVSKKFTSDLQFGDPLESHAFRLGEMFGKLIIMVGIIVVIIVVIVRVRK